jgi:hypothetical protein
MAKYLLPLLCLVVSCSPTSKNQCLTDVDCGDYLVCDDGTCVAPPPDAGTSCTSGETRPCGPAAIGVCQPGAFRCINGVFETTCSGQVTASDETCNGLDDDCDGEVDDGAAITFFVDRDGDGFGSSAVGAESRQACETPMGFSANASDCDDSDAQRKPTAAEVCDALGVDEDCDGVANEGCGCSNVGMMQTCCSGRGTQTCTAQDAGPSLSMCTVRPSLEFCNAIDDDCDGQTDELFAITTADGGVPPLDAGTILADGGCTIGVGACTRTANVSCVMGSLRCNAVAGTPGSEVCNGIDDNCDGQTDEPTTGLCAATNQVCNSGACACPSGQTVCGGSCEPIGGSCSAGVGACARNGAIACVSGGPACDAVPGAPTAEICDGIDNNCDSTVDEGVTITCLVDADNDKANGGTTTSNHCPDSSRAAFGLCPLGYVAPSAATNVDCDDTNAAIYRSVSTLADGDNDGRCNGSTMMECIGASAPQGRRISDSCVASTDCDDANANAWVLGLTRADQDGDGYCLGAAANTCNGTTAAPGRKFPTSCNAADDCNDTSAAQFTARTVRNDADSDTYCVGASFVQCGGATPGAGTRLASSCNATNDDCNDLSSEFYRNAVVRADTDGDQYCTGGTLSQCIGVNPASGYRFSNLCQATDDCNATDGTRFRTLSVMEDRDNDLVCVGAVIQQCTGQNPQQGFRLTSECAPFGGTPPVDCNDTTSNEYQLLSVRLDADGDTYCVGTTISQCTNNNPKPGYRLVTQCAGVDCRDSNPNARDVCDVTVFSQTRIKACGFGIPTTQALSFDWACPAGFQAVGSGFQRTNPEAIISDAQSSAFVIGGSGTSNVNFSCRAAAVGQDSWRLNVACQAL